MSRYKQGDIVWYKSWFHAYTGEVYTVKKTLLGYRYYIKGGDDSDDIWHWRMEWRIWQ